MDITLIAELVLFVILMALSGFFSSSETSLFSLNELQLEQMRRDDNPRTNLVERLLSEPRRLIVTILIGNEFVNVAASVISAAIVIQVLGAENKMVNLFIMVPVLLLVGEITPKTLAIRHNVAFATFQSGPIDLFARLISPLRWLIRYVAEWFTTLIVGSELDRSSIVTRDMVRTLAREAVGDGVLDQNEARYIEQIFDFGNRTVEDVMTPRSNVLFIPEDMPIGDVLAELKRTRHTKVPIYREHRDAVLGMLHVRDLLAVDLEMLERQPGKLTELLREPYFVPETKPARELFHAFRKRCLSVALAVDEYGGVTGLISMEDLLECIFGDIPSPSDTIEQGDVEVADDGTRRVNGALPISQFNDEFGASLETGEFETIGGRVLHELGELPDAGTSIVVEGFSFTVEEVESNRLKTLTVRELLPGEPDAEQREKEA
ncbi:MAG: hemolysin family protein [Gammaproteobacteria bacterium]